MEYTQIDQPAEAAQVEGGYHMGRTKQPLAVHAHQELAPIVVGAEEM